MFKGLRTLLVGSCALLLLSGCGYRGTSGTGSGGNGDPIGSHPQPNGTNDLVVATPSVAGTVSVMVGGKQTISITFTSSDGNPITGFGVSGTLGALPAGWSGPASFACASVSTGSGCVLNLTYAPTAVATGTLAVNYVFVDNAGAPSTGGSLKIPYAAITHNNVVAATSPIGQINAVLGGSGQSVSVNFTTDDGRAATKFTLTTNLGTLPAGWSSTATGLSCAIVSTGNGCQLPLMFAPTAPVSGTLTLNYSYTDDSGAARTGALNIPYATSVHNNIVATPSPSGQINAVEPTGSQPVSVTFTTDDGKPATALYLTTNLTALPAGWTSASTTFNCGSVSTGSGCQLQLTYAPAALTSGTLILNYSYTDGAGAAKTGSLNIAYAATSNDNAVATVSPTGQITAVAPSGSQAVTVTFTTDDSRAATALQLTSSLSALPVGWSSTDTSFSCAGFGGGSTVCQLPLTFAPAVYGGGTLTLNYSYMNNASESKTGTVNIAYQGTTSDNVVGTPDQSTLNVVTGSSTVDNITFTTDDGNPATNFSITSGLGTLPAGWSSTSGTLTCANVSTGTSCQLGLTYAPTTFGSGTLSFGYSYTDDSGTPKTGTASIQYSAMVPPQLYVAQLSGSLLMCALNTDGTLGTCANAGAVGATPTGIVFNGSFAYVADYLNYAVNVCNVGLDGSLSGCAGTGSNFTSPWQLAVSGSFLYATSASMTGGVTTCAINTDGSLSACTATSGSGTAGVAASSGFAYIGTQADTVNVCTIVAGALSGCTSTGGPFVGLDGVYLSGGYAYVANTNDGSVSVCTVNATGGGLSGCTESPVGGQPTSVVIMGTNAYVDDASGNVYLCAVGTLGGLTGCVPNNDGGNFNFGVQLAIH
jgi:hypothetical protein